MEKCNCSKASVEKTKWNGEDAVRFFAGGYEALIIPGIGANLIELKDSARGLSILRVPPDDIEFFKAKAQVYGIPVLFPPNRIEDGTFKAAGRVYNFPINEPKNNNNLHGFFKWRPFKVTRMETLGDDTASVEVAFINDSTTDLYEIFPHEFEFKMLYTLSKDGLNQRITIKNNSDSPMPMGQGFHIAFNVPFSENGSAEDCRLKASVGDEWELSNRLLPTGKIIPLEGNVKMLREDGMPPQGFPIEKHFMAKPLILNGSEFNGAIIEDRSIGLKLVYKTGIGYKHWLIWNGPGDKGFICPEPQTWMTNAPNVNLPHELTGFRLLTPGEIWEENCSIYIEKI